MNIERECAVLEPEIVTVISHCRLIDPQSEEHMYWRRNGQGLAAGYYVVSWPARITGRSFNEDAIFQGPFRNLAESKPVLSRVSEKRMQRPVKMNATAPAAPTD